jgi:hypothetical protein
LWGGLFGLKPYEPSFNLLFLSAPGGFCATFTAKSGEVWYFFKVHLALAETAGYFNNA